MTEVTEKLIKDMEVGEVGYTVYWAIYTVPNSFGLTTYAIRGDYDAISEPHGTMNVRIVRREHSVGVSVGALVEHKDTFGTAPLNLDWDWMDAIPMPNE